MKKAFTLIELLVVIAIIAILAAILFPVFAQAKLAAKKAVSISNQKQIGLSVIMYSNDYDDKYPRQDTCNLNSSLVAKWNNQPAGTDPTPYCNGYGIDSNGDGGYAFRNNHYSWGTWLQPYMKSAGLFYDPVIQPYTGVGYNSKDPVTGSYGPDGLVAGEISGGYALNLAITGAISAWPKVAKYGIRDPFLGGTTTGVPSPAEAMLVMDQAQFSIIGGLEWGTTSNGYELTYYPLAVKEHWEGYFYQTGGTGPCGEQDGVLDNVAAPYSGQVPLSYCDGHTKTIPVGQFLANTPTAAQYGINFSTKACSMAAAYYFNKTVPSWTQSWPMWGLQ
jgi:prepilin-type N-terminal cleavage/methylation domain-containing protein